MARVGDLVAYCASLTSDVWTLAPVAAVDDRGVVMGVRMRSGEIRSLWDVCGVEGWFVVSAEKHDLDRLQRDRWIKFRGLDALRHVIGIARRRA